MKYYYIRVTNLGMGWFRWKPKYMKGKKKYFFWFNWRIDFEVTDKCK
jgi:hypothetical protein